SGSIHSRPDSAYPPETKSSLSANTPRAFHSHADSDRRRTTQLHACRPEIRASCSQRPRSSTCFAVRPSAVATTATQQPSQDNSCSPPWSQSLHLRQRTRENHPRDQNDDE